LGEMDPRELPLLGPAGDPPELTLFTSGMAPDQFLESVRQHGRLGSTLVHLEEDEGLEQEDQARSAYLGIQAQLHDLLARQHLTFGGVDHYWLLGHTEKSLWQSDLPDQLYALARLARTLSSGQYA